MRIRAIRTRVFKKRENLAAFVLEHIPTIKEGSVLVVTSKIVALAEGRTTNAKNPKEKATLIRAESEVAIPTPIAWLTLVKGMLIANAGIDESNGNGELILLPKDSYRSARRLRKELMARYKLSRLGVLITDSRVLPLRAGALGVSVGYAGFSGLTDYRGTPDLFGRPFAYATANIADALAASAVLSMGEGAESKPLAVIEGADIAFTDKTVCHELEIAPEHDLYAPLLTKLRTRR